MSSTNTLTGASSEPRTPTVGGRWLLLALLPTTLALVWLVFATLTFDSVQGSGFLTHVSWMLPALLAVVSLSCCALGFIRRSRKRLVFALALPCFVAPLGMLAPWYAGPGNLGVGFGGWQFFLGWLTKYPNWGPINTEVLAGIACMMFVSLAPVGFAAYRLFAAVPSHKALVVGLALHTTVYAVVVYHLDFMVLVLGTFGLIQHGQPFPVMGPLYRLLAIACMALLAYTGRRPLSIGKAVATTAA